LLNRVTATHVFDQCALNIKQKNRQNDDTNCFEKRLIPGFLIFHACTSVGISS